MSKFSVNIFMFFLMFGMSRGEDDSVAVDGTLFCGSTCYNNGAVSFTL